MTSHVAVPPTPYYYGLRAEWFRKEAKLAWAAGQKEHSQRMYARYEYFLKLSDTIPFGIPNSEEE